jgi:hypothetical protein
MEQRRETVQHTKKKKAPRSQRSGLPRVGLFLIHVYNSGGRETEKLDRENSGLCFIQGGPREENVCTCLPDRLAAIRRPDTVVCKRARSISFLN